MELKAVPGTKAEDNGLRKAASEVWGEDRSWRRIVVRLPERSNGVEAEELEAPTPGDPRYSTRNHKKTWMTLAATPS